jgi:hypothetical protein
MIVMGLCLQVVVNQEDKLFFTLIWMHVGIVYISTCIHGLTSFNGVGFYTFFNFAQIGNASLDYVGSSTKCL